MLRAYGYSPRLARGGAEGVKLAVRHRPDLVLLDIRMPDMDGYEVAGFDGYIEKPIDPETFLGEVEAFLPEALASSAREARAAGR